MQNKTDIENAIALYRDAVALWALSRTEGVNRQKDALKSMLWAQNELYRVIGMEDFIFETED